MHISGEFDIKEEFEIKNKYTLLYFLMLNQATNPKPKCYRTMLGLGEVIGSSLIEDLWAPNSRFYRFWMQKIIFCQRDLRYFEEWRQVGPNVKDETISMRDLDLQLHMCDLRTRV